jgi:hypothetical protein
MDNAEVEATVMVMVRSRSVVVVALIHRTIVFAAG